MTHSQKGLIMRLLATLTVLLFLTGCASNPVTQIDYTKSTVVDYPEKGSITTRGLGDRLVAKGMRTVGPALEIATHIQFNKKEGESSILTCAATVGPGTYFKKGVYTQGESRSECYGPAQYFVTREDGSTSSWDCTGAGGVGNVCETLDGKYFLAYGWTRLPLEQDFQHLSKSEKTIENRDNFIQEILYNGRIGNNLKFVYREFSNDYVRPAFTQEVQYDLSQSNIIGFKTLRLEVIDATNTEITYKLLQNF